MISVDWSAFALVLGASVAAAALVVTLFSTGIRFWSTPAPGTTSTGAARDEETDEAPPSRPRAATALGLLMFVLAGAIVLSGVVLIVT